MILEKVNKIFKFLLGLFIVAIITAIIAHFIGEGPVKTGFIDCHSDPTMDCYGIYQDGNTSNKYLDVLWHFYLNREDSLRPISGYEKKALFMSNERKEILQRILNEELGIKIKNHIKVKYKESSIEAYAIEVDSVDRKIFIHSRMIKPTSSL